MAKRKTIKSYYKNSKARRKVQKAADEARYGNLGVLSPLKSVRRKALRRRMRKIRRRRRKARPINVEEEKQVNTHSYKKTRVTKQQQKLINRRFKNGYSPFEYNHTNQYQLTSSAATNKCKWLWFQYNDFLQLKEYMHQIPVGSNPAGGLYDTNNTYVTSQEQAIYISKTTHTYEIFNPSNYDQNLVIYDIIYKNDTDQACGNQWIETSGSYSSNYSDTYDAPLSLIARGIAPVSGPYVSGGNDRTQTTDPSELEITSIQMVPTKSYPFNIYCKIIRKHTYRLQAGATLTHKFVYRPKQLITRGYYGYKFKKYFSTGINPALKDITSGSLFKVWGQLSGTGASGAADKKKVATLAGKIMVKEYVNVKVYYMNPKYTYTFNDTTQDFTPTDPDKFEVINDETVKIVKTVDEQKSNNDGDDDMDE